ncbi:MAG: heavy-metal-associated domain-containing protein [Gammaproteobacteria bacterium]|nr:heavy-metal-associated domain-containing protein [Gammaproteobacteria bacterium]MBU0786547.1 heavy-metal-associated domain-containing protein [Gammaproteobacteria bacterium]MBU0817155.1 heavy-metal-associated domain-containing protein [Gammaproteobacteria bacterium]MBU1787724.1 heavy-metal-associated domain-containing protein [Gammaproteobacteria bacterium]
MVNTLTFEVQGMFCASCVDRITHALKSVNGISHVAVDLEKGSVRVNGESHMHADGLVVALSNLGYHAQLAASEASETCSQGTKSQPAFGRSGCCCST